MALSVSVYMLLSALLIIAAAVLSVLSAVLNSAAFGAVAVILSGVSAVLLALDSKRRKLPVHIFSMKASPVLRAASYFCAAGFVAETVSYALHIYDSYVNTSSAFVVIPLYAMTAVFALLSAFAAVLVGISFGDNKYNFTRFAIISFAPLFWAVLKVSNLLVGFVGLTGADSFFKLAVTVAAVSFFYRFSYETVKDESVSRLTLFSADAAAAFGFLYFVSRLSAALTEQKSLLSFDNLFALCVFTVAVFSMTLKINIIKNS